VRILTVCAEYAPFAKVGGLGDVTAGLNGWLARRGHQVVVVMPYYGCVAAAGFRLEPHAAIGPRCAVVDGVVHEYAVHRLAATGGGSAPDLYAVDAPTLFGHDVYSAGEIEAARFLLLSRAALELAVESGLRPDIVHCHDWHAAPAALMLKSGLHDGALRDSYAVLTIHNIGYQGVFAAAVLERSGLGALRPAVRADDLARGDVNFLKAGIGAADALTTVSPTHAREIQTPEYGKGLDALLRQRRHRLAGILNAVDYAEWSPEADALLPARYSARDLAGKRAVRAALVGELGLDVGAPTAIAGLVSRLAEQKGIDLLVNALPDVLDRRDLACAILGSGEPRYVEALAALAEAYPRRVVHVDAHDERLAHLILAGSDLALVPSLYEPCGLTQMYAMRYGTVPVVRRTGGLADTVTHFDPATGEGTGSVFLDADVGGLAWGLDTALGWFADTTTWERIIRNGMRQDFSWDRQGPHYEELFARLVRG
jgi:starch synthase